MRPWAIAAALMVVMGFACVLAQADAPEDRGLKRPTMQ